MRIVWLRTGSNPADLYLGDGLGADLLYTLLDSDGLPTKYDKVMVIIVL